MMALAIIFIWMKLISLPKQVLAPALNVMNLKDGTCTIPPLSEIHLSGLNSRQSWPHMLSILPIEYKEYNTLVFGLIQWPLGRISDWAAHLCSKGIGGNRRNDSHIAPWRYTSLLRSSMFKTFHFPLSNICSLISSRILASTYSSKFNVQISRFNVYGNITDSELDASTKIFFSEKADIFFQTSWFIGVSGVRNWTS